MRHTEIHEIYMPGVEKIFALKARKAKKAVTVSRERLEAG
jgi:hypothetical protein